MISGWPATVIMRPYAGTSVDTDTTFHTYRIEVNGVSLGSPIQVYYDNALTRCSLARLFMMPR